MEISKSLLTEVKDFCGISGDEADETIVIPLIYAAESYIAGAVGDVYPREDEKARLLLKVLVNDFYNNRDFENAKVSNGTRKIVDNIVLQLQMEFRRFHGI